MPTKELPTKPKLTQAKQATKMQTRTTSTSIHTANNFKRNYLAACIALCGVFCGSLTSATALAEHSKESIEHILVEGSAASAIDGHASHVHQDVIARERAVTNDSASILDAIAGVSLYRAGAVSSLPAIHGLADDRVRIKVDGMDLIAACPNHMNPPLSYVDPSEVEAITVFAGIAPVSSGGDSIGGTVKVSTVAPAFLDAAGDSETEGEVNAFWRSNNNAVGGSVSLTHATQQWFVRYSGNWSQADNYVAADNFKTSEVSGRAGHLIPLDEVASTAYETQNHSVRVAYRQAADTFDLRLGYQTMPEQLYPNQRMDLLDNEQFSANLRWQRDTDWGAWDARIYHEKVDHFMDFGADKQFWYGSNAMGGVPCEPIRYVGDPEGTCAGGMPMYSESKNSGVSVQAAFNLADQDTLKFGIEAQWFTLDDYWTASGGSMGPGTFWNINNGQRDRFIVYIEREQQVNEQWSLVYGIRGEQVAFDADPASGYSSAENAPGMQYMNAMAFNNSLSADYDFNTDASLQAQYRASATFNVELGLARKVRSANLYEKYPWSFWAMAASMNNFVGDGNGYVGNIALEPEVAHTVSASFDWHSEDYQHQLVIAPYYTEVSDYIDAVAANPMWKEDQFNVLQYQNQDARIYGVDVTAKAHLGHGDYGHWNILGTATVTDAKNTDTGSGLYNIVPLHGKIAVQQTFGQWDNVLEVEYAAAKDDVSDVRNEVETAGYMLVNLKFSYQMDDLRIDAGVENLLDKFYFLPTGGAYTAQGKTMSINGIPYGIGVPGMGRSLFVGATYTF